MAPTQRENMPGSTMTQREMLFSRTLLLLAITWHFYKILVVLSLYCTNDLTLLSFHFFLFYIVWWRYLHNLLWIKTSFIFATSWFDYERSPNSHKPHWISLVFKPAIRDFKEVWWCRWLFQTFNQSNWKVKSIARDISSWAKY